MIIKLFLQIFLHLYGTRRRIAVVIDCSYELFISKSTQVNGGMAESSTDVVA